MNQVRQICQTLVTLNLLVYSILAQTGSYKMSSSFQSQVNGVTSIFGRYVSLMTLHL